jgi:preprotein translocase subunit Sec61beta
MSAPMKRQQWIKDPTEVLAVSMLIFVLCIAARMLFQ